MPKFKSRAVSMELEYDVDLTSGVLSARFTKLYPKQFLPLHRAVELRQLSILEMLLRVGAALTAVDDQGRDTLSLARELSDGGELDCRVISVLDRTN